jgi:hypothetical protein
MYIRHIDYKYNPISLKLRFLAIPASRETEKILTHSSSIHKSWTLPCKHNASQSAQSFITVDMKKVHSAHTRFFPAPSLN